MTQRVHQIRRQDGSQPNLNEPPTFGKCNVPIWAAIDPARHIRICGNPVEKVIPAEVAQ